MPSRPPSHRRGLQQRASSVAAPMRDTRSMRADTPEQREADRLRSTARWQKARAKVLGQEPMCRPCSRVGRERAATQVDHITPIVGRSDLAFVEANLQPICDTCHRLKSADERRHAAQRGQGAGTARKFSSDTGSESSDA